jgi:hypothetical protein
MVPFEVCFGYLPHLHLIWHMEMKRVKKVFQRKEEGKADFFFQNDKASSSSSPRDVAKDTSKVGQT